MKFSVTFVTLVLLCSVTVSYAESWQTQLDRDIQIMNMTLSPSRQSQAARMALLTKLTRTIHQIWPRASMYPFGSTVTGLNTVSSDTDVFIHGIPGIYSPVSDYYSAIFNSLRRLNGTLIEQNVLHNTLLIPASIPLLRVRYYDEQYHETVSVDVSIQEPKSNQSTKLLQNYIYSDPVIVPVYKVIKTLLAKHQLNNYYRGGLKSVSVALMLIHMIHANDLNTRQLSAAQILLSFLQLYGHELNTAKTILYTPTMEYLDRAPIPKGVNVNSTLVIVDPTDLKRDMALKTYRYEEIRRLFGETLALLKAGVPLSQIV